MVNRAKPTTAPTIFDEELKGKIAIITSGAYFEGDGDAAYVRTLAVATGNTADSAQWDNKEVYEFTLFDGTVAWFTSNALKIPTKKELKELTNN